MALGAAFTNISSTLVFIVLARLLTPNQFGIVAFAAIFMDIARVLTTGGMIDILVERPDWDETTASSAFWANIALGLALALAIGGVAAPLSARFYDPTFGLVLAAMAPLPLIDAIATVPMARLKRDFGYKAIAARGSAMALIGGLVGIALAWLGWGVWALVIGKLVGVALASLILWLSAGWRPRFTFSWPHLRPIAGPSGHLLGSQLAAQFNAQVVGLMIGGVLGPAAVAHYRVGARVLTLLSSLLISPLQASAISVFSSLDNREKTIGPAYLRLTRACSLVAAPAYLGLAAVGTDLVRILFGPQWGLAGWIVSFNGLVVGAAILMYFFGPAMTAAGRAQSVFRTWLAALAGNIATAAIALPFGLLPVAGAQALRPYLTLPLALRLLDRELGIKPRKLLVALAPALGAAALMAILVSGLRWTLLIDMAPLPRLALMVAIGAPLYLMALRLIDPALMREMRRDVSSLLPRRRAIDMPAE